MIVLKNINFTLDPASIEMAIQVTIDFRNHLRTAMEQLIQTLIKKGVEIAKAELIFFWNPAYDTGTLSNSIVSEMLNEREGVVKTDVDYAMFVEYGTGIVGAIQHHPEPNGYQYDIHEHGIEGWVYFGTDGKFHTTAGMASRPFMYNTLRDLEEEAKAIGGQVIAEYIP